MLCEQRNSVPYVISVRNCKLKYGNQARKATYSIPTKWLKKIKVGIIEFIASPGVRSKALKPKPLVTFNVPSGVNVTFWPRRIYGGIYDGRRISRCKMGYFVFRWSDNFRSENLVAARKSRYGGRGWGREGSRQKQATEIIIANAIMRTEPHGTRKMFSREP